MIAQHDRLRSVQVFGYGVGDFGTNLFFTGLNLYLLYYYTDVLGIPPATAGIIFMLPIVWDGLFDPVMGWIASRTRSRFGRYRPYLLFGTPLMSLFFVMMFAAPLFFPNAVIAASLISHILFRTFFAIVNVPYSTMMASMTQDSGERSKLAGARMIGAILGGLVAAAVTLELAKTIGGGELKRGFVSVAIIYGLAALAMLWFTFFTSADRFSNAVAVEEKPLSTRSTFAFLKANKALWIVFAGVIIGALGHGIFNGAVVYYIKYNAGLPDKISLLFTVILIAAVVSIPVWFITLKRLSKRQVWMLAATGTILTNATLFALAPKDPSTLMVLLGISGFFFGAFAITFWAMLPDTVEYGEWRSGIRDEGIGFGLGMLAQKAGSGVGVGILGLALGAIGYLDNQAQSAATMEGIRMLAFLPVIGTSLITIAIIHFYPIDAAFHQKLVEEIGTTPATPN